VGGDVEAGWNRVVDADEQAIALSTSERWWPAQRPLLFGDGKAAEKLVAILLASSAG